MDNGKRRPILRYTLDAVPQVLRETTGGQSTRNLYALDLFAQQQGEATTYLGYDALSVRLHVDGNGAIAAAYRYGPFGEVVGEGPEGYGYTGEQWDSSTKMTFLRARYYQPETGRFVSRDPWSGELVRPMTLQRFNYVVNNPLRFIDPSGLQPWLDITTGETSQFGEQAGMGVTDTTPDWTYPYSAGGSPPVVPLSSPTDFIGFVPLYVPLRDVDRAVAMVEGGMRFKRGAQYAGQIIIYGDRTAMEAAEIPLNYRNARGLTSPSLCSYLSPAKAAGKVAGSAWTWVSVGITWVGDGLEYSVGRKKQVGVFSMEFAAAVTVDTATGVGLPAAGAALGTAIAPGVGTVIGATAGGIGDFVLRTFFPNQRESVIQAVKSGYDAYIDVYFGEKAWEINRWQQEHGNGWYLNPWQRPFNPSGSGLRFGP